MPKCGTQCTLCDLPIRFDTYKGCSHGCKYCFANQFRDISKIKKDETVASLRNFIEGKRNETTKWCDWNIPIHWGGMSDPFQPCEKIIRNSYECLKLLEKTKYPFIVSTKGKLIADDEYLRLLETSNCVVQISAVCSKYDKIEKGCPTFEERVKIIKKISPRVQRVIVRIQPYMHEVFKDVYDNLKIFKDAGAYGVIIEGMKFKKKKKGLVKVGGDFTYDYELIKNDFLLLKERCHQLGLKIYAGENRIRKYGDSLSCCGVDGLDDFIPNKYNINHFFNDVLKVEPSKSQLEIGSASVFKALKQTTSYSNYVNNISFADEMKNYCKTNASIKEVLGYGR